uniref:Uncharacterized protein n=1 Tax=Arundo donax TaxID=35708 RepID=A0A0A9BYN4_ARUDO
MGRTVAGAFWTFPPTGAFSSQVAVVDSWLNNIVLLISYQLFLEMQQQLHKRIYHRCWCGVSSKGKMVTPLSAHWVVVK